MQAILVAYLYLLVLQVTAFRILWAINWSVYDKNTVKLLIINKINTLH